MAAGAQQHTSRYISRRQMPAFMAASGLARDIGLPLNTFTTINYGHIDCDGDETSRLFRHLLRRRFAPWLEYKRKRGLANFPPTYLWVVENSPTELYNMPHVHWMVHVPHALKEEFDEKLTVWIKSTAGALEETERVVETKPVTRLGLHKYIAKDASEAMRKHYNITYTPTNGIVVGKRVGISQNLNTAEQAAFRRQQLDIQRQALLNERNSDQN